jgi:hypothetical protein
MFECYLNQAHRQYVDPELMAKFDLSQLATPLPINHNYTPTSKHSKVSNFK